MISFNFHIVTLKALLTESHVLIGLTDYLDSYRKNLGLYSQHSYEYQFQLYQKKIKYMLKKNEPRTDPCNTPDINSVQEFKDVLIF